LKTTHRQTAGFELICPLTTGTDLGRIPTISRDSIEVASLNPDSIKWLKQQGLSDFLPISVISPSVKGVFYDGNSFNFAG